MNSLVPVKTEMELLLMFNHTLTEAQYRAAVQDFGVAKARDLPKDLKKLWGQIPAEAGDLTPILAPFRDWLKEFGKKGSPVLIQGDFGATYAMVNYADRLGFVPIYATTTRKAWETRQADGTVKTRHLFEFCRFRRYIWPQGL